METRLKVPLFPLPNVVHFPETELRLHVFEPRYRSLVRDLESERSDRRWIGMVLLKADRPAAGPPPIYSSGTAGRLVDVEHLPDGRANILLLGDFRFQIFHEVKSRPYRQAMVELIQEPSLNEGDPGVLAVRKELVTTSQALAGELRDNFPLAEDEVARLEAKAGIAQIVNAIAAELDLPPVRKLQLLNDPLPERALNLLSILRSRKKVLDLLRPYRHLAQSADLN